MFGGVEEMVYLCKRKLNENEVARKLNREFKNKNK